MGCPCSQRLLPPYTEMGLADAVMSETICRAGRFYVGGDTPPRYYFGIYGGRVCAAYEVSVETFTGPCTENIGGEVRSEASAGDTASQAVM